MVGIVRPVTLTVIRGKHRGNTYQKLIYSITNRRSRLPNIILYRLLGVLLEVEEYYAVWNDKLMRDEYPFTLTITSVSHVKSNRCEIRLSIPNVMHISDMDESVSTVVWQFLDSMHEGLESEFGIGVYRKGDV